jgi:F420-dependent oxidoreductase-like protein
MKLGLQIPDFSWPGGNSELGSHLAEIVQTADEVGFTSIWVMDHFFQIQMIGPPEREMLEAYTTLGFIAGHTKRARLGTMVTGVTYRHPGILAKTVTALDVLSGGRAYLGIGAAWNEEEHRGMGVPFPPLGERFERLEETLQICRQMWSGQETPFHGKHYQLERTLNSPQAVSKPHPPIMIGGMGEQKTLRLVAQYADACNLFPDLSVLPHKLDVLRRHCEEVGRNYDEIEKTAMFRFDVGTNGSGLKQMEGFLRALAGVGIQTAIGSVANVAQLKPLETIGRELMPAVADLQPAGRAV